MTFELKGIEAFADGLAKVSKDARRGAALGLGLGARLVLDVSNDQVPHEVGDLERDGTASVDDEALRAAVSYGRNGELAIIAVVQHEDMGMNHDPGRNAKYLENAFNSEAGDVSEIIAYQTRKAMGS